MLRSLDRTQRWFLGQVTGLPFPQPASGSVTADGNAASDNVAAEEAPLEDYLLPSRRLSAERRFDIYVQAYRARLVECLATEFPALETLLGTQNFRVLCLRYLDEHPSTSFTLADLGTKLPEFLNRSRHDVRRSASEPARLIDFLVDLAALERALAETHIACEDLERIPLAPGSVIGVRRMRILELGTTVHDYARAVREGNESPDPPRGEPTCVIVLRRALMVRMFPIDIVAGRLLRKLSELGDLDLALAASPPDDLPLDASELSRWLVEWHRDGLIAIVGSELGDHATPT